MSTVHTERAWGRAQYDWSEMTPSVAVVETIAAVENVEPDELVFGQGLPLSEYFDPDALDSLVTHDDITIAFTGDEYQIRIDGSHVGIHSE
ncbi:hypothetical protein HUG10_02915 [Halorarum halophilum]|uniref:Halobacterial output domain-containing protein n=1 Tax=Halorarum halophilum TaxID=2743090 RepID=A0A7D5K6A6_9EURY|nr:HalOD1 output domain-containing protein [Halobaculum halophilum]QLG26554.1 hypothetical protein HUG10_02915 [Halobaculum halophilum]